MVQQKSHIKEFLILFTTQVVSYFLVTINYRAISQANYGAIAISDLLFASMGFFVVKRIVKSESIGGWIGYTLGGVVGSLSATYLSVHWFGK